MTLWLWCGLLMLTAAGFVAWPLLRSRVPVRWSPAGRERASTVKALYRERLDELDREIEIGQLSLESRDAMEAEIGVAALADTASDDEGPAEASERPKPLIATLAVGLLAVSSLVVYQQVGEPDAPYIAGAAVILSLDPHSQRDQIELWRDRLQERVSSRPDDAQSWYLLGHALLKFQRFAEAAQAFAMAHGIVGDDPNVDIYWLQARFLAGRGVIDATTRGIAERLLARQPNHPLVLDLFAIDAFRQDDFRAAVGYLNRALTGPLAPAQRDALGASLAEARGRMGDLTPSIDVRVEAAQPPPEGATLFVIARPVGGGVPFAVIRRPDARFPAALRLDDAVAMNPQRPLSGAAEVQLVVRLSLSGSAKAEPEDWQWESAAVALTEVSSPLTMNVALAPPAQEGAARP